MPFMEQQPGLTSAQLKETMQKASAKILLLGDTHIADRPPSSCTETYLDDLLDMLTYVAKIEKAIQADAVVIAGDIFDHKTPSRTSHATMLKVMTTLAKFNNVWAIGGNHDMQGDREESIREKQPLGVLFESGALNELDGWHPTLPLFGVPWQQRWADEDTPLQAFEEYRSLGGHDGTLAVTHAPIYPLGHELEFEYVPTDGPHGISQAMGNQGYLYYGHIHEPHGVHVTSGVTYANFGALSRGSLHEYNLNRKIQIGLWSPEYAFQRLDIPHKPAQEVFRLQEATARKEERLSLDSFLSQVGQSTLDYSSTEQVIEHIKGLDAVERPVKDRAIEFLQDVH